MWTWSSAIQQEVKNYFCQKVPSGKNRERRKKRKRETRRWEDRLGKSLGDGHTYLKMNVAAKIPVTKSHYRVQEPCSHRFKRWGREENEKTFLQIQL